MSATTIDDDQPKNEVDDTEDNNNTQTQDFEDAGRCNNAFWRSIGERSGKKGKFVRSFI